MLQGRVERAFAVRLLERMCENSGADEMEDFG